jgi:hypothetical protein
VSRRPSPPSKVSRRWLPPAELHNN